MIVRITYHGQGGTYTFPSVIPGSVRGIAPSRYGESRGIKTLIEFQCYGNCPGAHVGVASIELEAEPLDEMVPSPTAIGRLVDKALAGES